MMTQASVVEVDRADDGGIVVADEDLRMHKARRIFVDAHARPHQRRIIRLRQRIRRGLVRHARQDQPHVHAALGGIDQRVFQLAVQNQIRRHDVDVFLRAAEDVNVHALAELILVQRTIPIGDDEARRADRLFRRIEIGIIHRPALLDVPHLQKHQREAAHSVAVQHHRGILPMAELADSVDVLIRQIHAAAEGRMAVDHQDFAVVAVVIVGREEGRQRRERLAADAERPQPGGIIAREA